MDKLYRLFTKTTGRTPETVSPITGSGSNREYFRISAADRTFIGTVGKDIRENEAYLHIASRLKQAGISVPETVAVSEDRSCYLQEDLGDTSLFSMLERNEDGSLAPETMKILEDTVSQLPRIQYEGGRLIDFRMCWPQQMFDRRTVMFDLNYFKYCYLKTVTDCMDEYGLEDDFCRLADDLTGEATGNTFMYRDFQSRNAMIRDGKPHFIDFQGGRKGPVYYDVASFVWQARAGFTEKERDRLTEAYMQSLSEYTECDREQFSEKLRTFTLFRTLQVLGAYGFRGGFERKEHFLKSIPAALSNIRTLRKYGKFSRYPVLDSLLAAVSSEGTDKVTGTEGNAPSSGTGMQEGNRTRITCTDENRKDLRIRIYSFSYRKGIPEDTSGNGGGYVFDCRAIENPGKHERYRYLTGMDREVMDFLENPEMPEKVSAAYFMERITEIADAHVERYISRGFTDLMFCFGCTGGRHRSVYCAEKLAGHINSRYGLEVTLTHREQKMVRTFSRKETSR